MLCACLRACNYFIGREDVAKEADNRVQSRPLRRTQDSVLGSRSIAQKPAFGRSVHEQWSTQLPGWQMNLNHNRVTVRLVGGAHGQTCDNAIEQGGSVGK
jgi:hypothetical protein